MTALENYDPIREVAPGLWCIDGDWQESEFRRRMTVMRVSSGDLVIHASILLRPEDIDSLKRLGRVVAIVVPNWIHGSDGPALAGHFPDAHLYVPAATQKKFSKLHPRVRSLETEWPAELEREVACIPVEGTRVHEAVFVHRSTRTLVVTDLVFNMPVEAFKGMMLKFVRWNGMAGKFGPSRVMKYLVTSDRKALFRSLDRIQTHDFDRVIMNHGTILESGGKALLKSSFDARY